MITYSDDKKGKWQSVTAIYQHEMEVESEVYVCVYGATEKEARSNLLEEMTKLNAAFQQDLANLQTEVQDTGERHDSN